MRARLIGLALIAAPAAALPTPSGFPEATTCPPTPGDLDAALFDFMSKAGFQQRMVDGTQHFTIQLPYNGGAGKQYMDVEFTRFVTSAGTRVVAQTVQIDTSAIGTYTPSRIAIQNGSFSDAFQRALSATLSHFPCGSTPQPK